jgi:hypothetical protein
MKQMPLVFGVFVCALFVTAQSSDQLTQDEIKAAIAAKPNSGFVFIDGTHLLKIWTVKEKHIKQLGM